ncbi:MAG: alpha amylase C-terminal domain-containing protein [Desulfovibrionaceae bacterium]|nr:alpha amylase C-terminal domain-containing protein [Desulfovibrionaceae bacterium]
MQGQPKNPLEDQDLYAYKDFLIQRGERFQNELIRITQNYGSLTNYANLHLDLGLHLKKEQHQKFWVWREYLPHASVVWLTNERLHFQRHAKLRFKPLKDGIFELIIPYEELEHGMYVELRVEPRDYEVLNPEGIPTSLKRVPAFADWVEQNKEIPTQWCARIYNPKHPYQFKAKRPTPPDFLRIYEAHVGMAQDDTRHVKDSVGTYKEFSEEILPRIKECGYTSVQLMAIPEHPLYRSFGYQVSSYFAPCSRFGSPDDLKAMIDHAHALGLQIILDITHAHSCANTEQGLCRYDGSDYFFTTQTNQWGTPTFDFSQEMTRKFLLSNLRYWLEEYQVDGFRFDAVGNMLYLDFGRDDNFSHTGRCFYGKDGKPRADAAGELYLCLANHLVHEIYPQATTIAEEFSGMPGLTCKPEEGGLGFNARFAMGIPDYWEKFIKEPQDLGSMWYEMNNHRPYDRTISYVECHDQCINGDDAMIWRLLGDDMYTTMAIGQDTWNISRGLAFYRLMRLITLTTADVGYLNFMGNEFGHPEWLDAEEHAHRQWRLAEDPALKYRSLAAWDKAQMKLVATHPEDFKQGNTFRFIHEDKRLLAFERGKLLLVFNFNETQAFDDLCFAVTPGKYVPLLSSDELEFAGHGNLHIDTPRLEHFTTPTQDPWLGDIKLYLPPMVALVLERD